MSEGQEQKIYCVQDQSQLNKLQTSTMTSHTQSIQGLAAPKTS